jgi:paraquat-inducible protein B
MSEVRDEDIPQAVESKPRVRTWLLIWLVPLFAAIIGGWLGFKAIWEHGPTITIQFLTGEGIEANKTRIKYKAVNVGTVTAVRLAPDHKSVIVTASIDRHTSEGFLVDDTRFWVVKPRIAGGQVSGLGTLLAGSYIGADPGKSEKERKEFVGLETPPPVTTDLKGRSFMLRADDLGSLDIGAPVYYRGIAAGKVISAEVLPDGKNVMVGVFIESPYDRFVNGESRFWNASGIDLSVDASGVKLETQSLLTLLVGGIAFESPPEVTEAPPAPADTQFRLWNARTEAMAPHEAVVENYRLVFTQSVRGLTVGSPVDFRGIVVGEVRAISLHHEQGTPRFETAVDINLWPERMRANSETPAPQRMQRFVAHGFRGQLRSANLITGQQFVALDFFPKAAPATLVTSRTPPEIPTIPGSLAEIQDSIGNIVKTLEKVPFDKLAADLRTALTTLDATLKRADAVMAKLTDEVAPELRTTLQQARKTLESAQHVLATDSPTQGDLRETLQEVTKAAENVRSLADYLERHPEALLRGKRSGGDDR